MKKIIFNFIFFFIITFIILISILSTIGVETNKFNNLISDRASQTKKINLQLKTIKFKINPKELSLFLETKNPQITYQNLSIPVSNLKVYIDFLSLFKSNLKIKKINIFLEELDIVQLNELSTIIKPSNLKSIINNKIKNGKLISEIEIFLDEQGVLKNFIAKGKINNLNVELLSDLNFTKVNLDFFADKNDVLIKNIFGDLGDINISNGDVKLNLDDGIKLNSNFNSKFNLDDKLLDNYSKFLNKFEFINNIKNVEANFNNSLFIDLDSTYKVKNYSYSILGKLEKGIYKLSNPFKSNLIINDEIEKIYLSNLKIKTVFSPKSINLNAEGKYSLNGLDFLKLNLENELNNDLLNLKLNLDFINKLELEIINFEKPKNTIANLSLNLEKNQENIMINKLSFEDKKNSIIINDLVLKKNKFSSFKKIKVLTSNNDFLIFNDKKILIKGKKFDGKNLAKFFKKQGKQNIIQNISKDIEIDFKNITAPMSETLQNFKLIGEINNGQFTKITSKGDFGGDNFLDITMKKDINTKKKYLEIYSDLTRPLLAEYSFFKGLSGGKLLFSSVIDDTKSNSKLKIENFKVVNAPGLIKLLSLADLGGLADLAEGDGLSFDILEIKMEKNKNFLKINEIVALGPSISVLMEGYQDENGLTSIRGTLVPAKTLNKMISKIPVIGNIVVPKEVGEGLFGVSFKMKGTEGKIKTTINPIRTLTPRFIQKIIDRNKETK